jgi:hypothetical protein
MNFIGDAKGFNQVVQEGTGTTSPLVAAATPVLPDIRCA